MGTLSVDKILKTSTGAAEFTLPATDGTSGQAMITDGSGQLSLGDITFANIQDISTANRLVGAVTVGTITEVQAQTDMIADNAVTLPKMEGITRGSVIIGNATSDPSYLAIGASGQVLTSDGSDMAWAAAAGGGAWELVASVTAAANTSTTIGGDSAPIFSSSHDNYVLMGIMRSNQDAFTPVQIQPILAGAGTTPDTTQDVQHVAPMMRSNTALGSTALTWSQQELLTAYNVSLNYNPMGTTAGEAHAFQMWFYDPFQNASFAHGQLANSTVSSWDANNYTSVLTYAYKKPTTTAYVGLVISNNASGGVDYLLRLYGIKNS